MARRRFERKWLVLETGSVAVGLDITYLVSSGELKIEQRPVREARYIHLGEFLGELGITETDCAQALRVWRQEMALQAKGEGS